MSSLIMNKENKPKNGKYIQGIGMPQQEKKIIQNNNITSKTTNDNEQGLIDFTAETDDSKEYPTTTE